MKKYSIAILSIILILSALCITSCTDKTPREPTKLNADFWDLTWSGHPDATEYIVEVDGEEYRTSETAFELFDYVAPGNTAQIRIKAVFGSDEDTSDWSEIEYKAEDATEGLVYELNDMSSFFDNLPGYTVYCPADKIPENGEIVIPDMYEGEFVVELKSETHGVLPISGNEIDYEGVSYSGITKIRLPNNLTNIGVGALYNASITKVHLPSSVTTIRERAFAGCTSLTNVILPQTLTELGAGAFRETAITEIDIPRSLQYINEYTFYNCTALADIRFTDDFLEMDFGALHNTAWYNSQPDGLLILQNRLYGYKGIMPSATKLVIPSTVTHFMGPFTFCGELKLYSVTIPGSIKRIPEGCFADCYMLHEVKLSEGLEIIGDRAFENNDINKIIIPSTLTELGEEAFQNCDKLLQVVFSKNTNLEEIDSRTFYGCYNLSEINIPSSVKRFASDAFTYCEILTSLDISDDATEFQMNTLCYTGIKHFVWPKNAEPQADYEPKHPDGCRVDYLVIQKETKYLQYIQFCIYENLDTFYFEGNSEEFKKIDIERSSYTENWESNLTVYYYSETEPTEEGNFWHYVDGVPTKW